MPEPLTQLAAWLDLRSDEQAASDTLETWASPYAYNTEGAWDLIHAGLARHYAELREALGRSREPAPRRPTPAPGMTLMDWLEAWAALYPGEDAVNFLRCASWLRRAEAAGVNEDPPSIGELLMGDKS